MTRSASRGGMIPVDVLLVLNDLIDYINNTFWIALPVYYITVYIGYAEYFKHFFGWIIKRIWNFAFYLLDGIGHILRLPLFR